MPVEIKERESKILSLVRGVHMKAEGYDGICICPADWTDDYLIEYMENRFCRPFKIVHKIAQDKSWETNLQDTKTAPMGTTMSLF